MVIKEIKKPRNSRVVPFNALAFSSHIPKCNLRRLKYFALK
jgi:hypothetical protein